MKIGQYLAKILDKSIVSPFFDSRCTCIFMYTVCQSFKSRLLIFSNTLMLFKHSLRFSNPITTLIPQDYPFCLGHIHPHLIRQCLDQPYSPPQATTPSLDVLLHNNPSDFSLVTMESPKLFHPQNCPFPFDDHHQNLTRQYHTPTQPPSPTASRSTQPFCHDTDCGQTDRPTDRTERRTD